MREAITRGMSAFLFVLLVVLAGCLPTGKSPTAPVSPTADYPVYFNVGTTVYQYVPASGDLESFEIPIDMRRVVSASVNGAQLWTAGHTEVHIIDMTTNTVLGHIQHELGGEIRFSPDGSLAALFGDTLRLVDTQTREVVFSDVGGGGFSGGVFSANGHRLYCIQGGDVYFVNLDDGYSTGHQAIPGYAVSSIWPSPDETRWYLIQDDLSACTIIVYDVPGEAVLHVEETTPGPIMTHMVPDGTLLYYTLVGGSMQYDFGPPFTFAVMDLEPPFVIRTVKIPIPTLQWPYFPFGRFAVTPDGNWIVGTWFQTRDMICYDLQNGTVSEVLPLDDQTVDNIFSQQYR